MTIDNSSAMTMNRLGVRLLALVLLALVLVGGTAIVNEQPADAASYHRLKWDPQDKFDFRTANGAVTAKGELRWYNSDKRCATASKAAVNTGHASCDAWDYWRGGFHGNVRLNKSGCLYARVIWEKVGTDVKWPDPGVSAKNVDTGYYRKCGKAGTTMAVNPAHVSRGLGGARLEIAYSRRAGDMPGHNAVHKMRIGGK